jgi:hypothetical protein
MEHRVRDQGSEDGKTKVIAGSSQLKEKGEDRRQTTEDRGWRAAGRHSIAQSELKHWSQESGARAKSVIPEFVEGGYQESSEKEYLTEYWIWSNGQWHKKLRIADLKARSQETGDRRQGSGVELPPNLWTYRKAVIICQEVCYGSESKKL